MDLTRFYATPARRFLTTLAGGLIVASAFTPTSLAAVMPNACPVDGCTARIVSVQMMGDELEVTLEANYTPDNARNHLHM